MRKNKISYDVKKMNELKNSTETEVIKVKSCLELTSTLTLKINEYVYIAGVSVNE